MCDLSCRHLLDTCLQLFSRYTMSWKLWYEYWVVFFHFDRSHHHVSDIFKFVFSKIELFPAGMWNVWPRQPSAHCVVRQIWHTSVSGWTAQLSCSLSTQCAHTYRCLSVIHAHLWSRSIRETFQHSPLSKTSPRWYLSAVFRVNVGSASRTVINWLL